MTTRRTRAVTSAAGAALLLLAGCGGTTDGSAAPSSAASGSTTSGSAAGPSSASGTPTAEPSAAEQEAAAEAAADPAAATDTTSAALASALRASDLPAGWTVQANPTPDGALGPSLAGICDYTFTSEDRRTTKFPVVGIDPQQSASLSSEAIAYDSAAGATLALQELATAFQGCSPEEYTFVDTPPADGLAPVNFRVAYQLTGGALQVVIAQVRGSVLSIILSGDLTAARTAGAAIALRLAALPAAAVGE